MFSVTSKRRDGSFRKHQVKALPMIWSKFPDRWSPANTIMIDDLSRNFGTPSPNLGQARS